jgi:hypothetical protein
MARISRTSATLVCVVSQSFLPSGKIMTVFKAMLCLQHVKVKLEFDKNAGAKRGRYINC